VKDALLLVDVLSGFRHEDGERLAASFARAQPVLLELIDSCRADDLPVIYANDHFGDWTADRSQIVERAVRGACGDLIKPIAPRSDEALLIKPRYSAFEGTPLRLLLGDLGTERILLAGTALEMCVTQTAITAREAGFKVSVMVDACARVDDANARIALAYLEHVVGVRLEERRDVAPFVHPRDHQPA
jgi:nicotinamidase-related amidase